MSTKYAKKWRKHWRSEFVSWIDQVRSLPFLQRLSIIFKLLF